MGSKRELAEESYEEWQKRIQSYPGMVRAGKLRQLDADRKIQRMHEIYRFIIRQPDEVFGGPEL